MLNKTTKALTSILTAGLIGVAGCTVLEDTELQLGQDSYNSESEEDFSGIIMNGVDTESAEIIMNGVESGNPNIIMNGVDSGDGEIIMNGLDTDGDVQIIMNGADSSVLVDTTDTNIIMNRVAFEEVATGTYTFNGFSFDPNHTAGLAVDGLGIDAVALNGLIIGADGTNGLRTSAVTLDAVAESKLISLLGYLSSCALSRNQSITITSSNGDAIVFKGVLGLATEWATGALTTNGKYYVTGCMAARSNGNGQSVYLSVRTDVLNPGDTERSVFAHREGSFWGNAFGANQAIHTCAAEGGGVAGRVCTSGDCGFIDNGSCVDVCAQEDVENGNFSGCNGQAIAVTTFLPMTSNMSFGGEHSCDIDGNGDVHCSGMNDQGQLGDGSTNDRAQREQVDLGGIAAAEVVAGKKHSCARLVNGNVRCWGRNKSGEAGMGSDANKLLTPSTDAPLVTDAMSIRSGAKHVCALEADGTVVCWGKNSAGQLGDSTFVGSNVPVVLNLEQDAVLLSTGSKSNHMCAISAIGQVYCWGKNHHGQLGDDTMINRSTPVRMALDENGHDNAIDVCTGKTYTCALENNGDVSCSGKIGSVQVMQPTIVGLSQPAIDISCSRRYACATFADGTSTCWGE